MNANVLLAVLGALVVGAMPAFLFGKRSGTNSERQRQAAAKATAEETSRRILADAEKESENLRKSAVVSGKEELIKLRENFELEVRGRREEVEREERRLTERENVLDRKFDLLEQRDKEFAKRASDFGRREKTVSDREVELEKLINDERRRLEQMAGLSAQDAKAELMRRMEEEAQADAVGMRRRTRSRSR